MANADVTAAFLHRVLHNDGTAQVYLKRGPDKAPVLLLESGGNFLTTIAGDAYGKVDAHFTLTSYRVFNPSAETRYKRASEYHTAYGRCCVVVDVDDKDTTEDLAALDHGAIAARLRVPPDIIVRSGRGGFHCYWVSHAPMSPAEFRRADVYLRDMVAESFKPDMRAGSTAQDTMRLPGSINPKSNEWCYVEVDYQTTTLTPEYFDTLPAMVIPGWQCPLGKPFSYPLSVQAGIPISTESPPPRFTNEQLRQCAAYQSIQDNAHEHAGHVIDLFYLSWARCIAKPAGVDEATHLEQTLEEIVIKPLAQCNSPLHYAQQWASLKDRPGLRCQNLESSTAEPYCQGCPQYRTDGGSPARLIANTTVTPPAPPQSNPPSASTAPPPPPPDPNQSTPLPPPNANQPMLPRGYAWSQYEPEKILKVDKEGKPLMQMCERIVLVGKAQIEYAGAHVQAMVLKMGNGLHVFPFRMNDNETLRRIGGVSSGASFLGRSSAVYQMLADWLKLVPDVDSVREKMGWLSNGGFCAVNHLVTPDGYIRRPLAYEDGNPSYDDLFELPDIRHQATTYWHKVTPYVSVVDNSVGRLVLLTQLASVLDRFLENVTRGNVWFSLRGETGTGKSSVLNLAKSVFGTVDAGASFTLSGLENTLRQQCEVPVVIDEFSMRGEAAKFESQSLLAVMAGHTGVRATRDGTQNAPTLSWKGFTIFASNEGLLNRLAGESSSLDAVRARVVEHEQKPSVDPRIPDYARAIAADTDHHGELGTLFAHWVVANPIDTQAIVDKLVATLELSGFELGGGPERFCRKWGLLCMAALQILDRLGFTIEGFDAARVWDADIEPTMRAQEARRQKARENDPLMSLDAFLRSRKITKTQIAGLNLMGAGKQFYREPVFVGFGYYYVPIEAVKAVAGQHKNVTDAEYDALCTTWGGTRRTVVLPDEGQDIKFDCIIVRDEAYETPATMIQETYRELVHDQFS